MNEVFTGTFEANRNGIMIPVGVEKVCGPEDVIVPAGSETYGIGIGFDRYEALDSLSEQLAGIRSDVWPKASSVLKLAQEWLLTHEALPAEQAQPVYLRDNVAKKKKDQ
jgi:tRNA threonylcarbamoyladenosine biosynthesis protein TsaB